MKSFSQQNRTGKNWFFFLHGFSVATCFRRWHFCLLYRGFFSSSDPVETRLCQVSICQGENFNFSLLHTHTHTHTLVTVTLIPRRSWLPLIGQFQQSHELNFIDMGSERKFLSEFWNNYDISLSGVLFSLPVSWPGCTGGSFPQASCAWRHWAFLLLLGLALM